MLSRLTDHFHPASPKVFPKWTQYVDYLKLQKRVLKKRYLNSDVYEARCFHILKHLLKTMERDMEYLMLQQNDFSRYLNYFKEVAQSTYDTFAPARTGKAYRKAFYKKGLFATTEYLCPVPDVDHLKTLPLDKSWDDWEKVKPVHLWHHDTEEYTLNIFSGGIVTKYNPPTYSIICIDAVALMFKYYKYMTMDITGETIKTMHDFIHRHVLVHLMDDLLEVWLFNRINYISKLAEEGESVRSLVNISPMSDRQFGYVGGRYGEAMEELYKAMIQVKEGSVRVNSILSAQLLPNGSILDRINYMNTYLDIPDTFQYMPVVLMRDIPTIDLMSRMYAWRPDMTMYRTMRRDILVELRRVKRGRCWERIYDSSIRLLVEDWMTRTEESLSMD